MVNNIAVLLVDGETATRMIKSTQNTNSLTPIVAVTAFPDLAAQIFDYMMVKPVTREEIEKRLQFFCPIQPTVSEVPTPGRESNSPVAETPPGAYQYSGSQLDQQLLKSTRSGSTSSSTTGSSLLSSRPLVSAASADKLRSS